MTITMGESDLPTLRAHAEQREKWRRTAAGIITALVGLLMMLAGVFFTTLPYKNIFFLTVFMWVVGLGTIFAGISSATEQHWPHGWRLKILTIVIYIVGGVAIIPACPFLLALIAPAISVFFGLGWLMIFREDIRNAKV